MKRIKSRTAAGFIASLLFFSACLFCPSAQSSEGSFSYELNETKLDSLDRLVADAVRDERIPGAVVLIGQGDRVLYRKAFGMRSLRPEKNPMTEDIIFDLASLTKVVATTTAVMQLIEKGKLKLDEPVATYWPALKKNGKSRITVRQLLTHYSGLKPDLRTHPPWSGYGSALRKIVEEKPHCEPGLCYEYSDLNFEVLGEVVRRVSGLRLDRYCRRNIFEPLGMRDTSFAPLRAPVSRIAPTVYRNGNLLCGSVHDPSCDKMGGIAGHAGLFSTADDLAIFARMMLKGSASGKVKILKPETIALMTSPQSPEGMKRVRGLGWDLEPTFAPDLKESIPAGAYGHLGYTGTAVWIDPVTRVYIILLTNRVHAESGGDVKALRAAVKAIVSDALDSGKGVHVPIGEAPTVKPAAGTLKKVDAVRFGIDVLRDENFATLRGLRVGLITNHTGIDSDGKRTVDLLYRAPGIQLKALFSPEHGLSGEFDAAVSASWDGTTGLPVYSLYGKTKRPTAEMLEGLDALVFDIQDAGARFYTYISTMGYAMEAAAQKGIAFYVLDRPNPITGSVFQGPVSERNRKSFTSYFPMPARHGMTAGELARMFNAEYGIKTRLLVIGMRGYSRAAWYDQTGRLWINPSPNLRSLTAATLYPGVALIEGANVSVGRGTPTPFEVLGAPWIRAEELAEYMNSRVIEGVRFSPTAFTPESSNYKGLPCQGVVITLVDRDRLDSVRLGIELISALQRLYPKKFRMEKTLGMLGCAKTLEALREGKDPGVIAQGWEMELKEFRKIREKYLLY